MRRPEFIARQGSCPTGVLGSLVACIMARETVAENAAALDLLRIAPTDQVLEIGFGHGRTIAVAAQRARQGFVAWIDLSERMYQIASRANRDLIRAGRVELKTGNASQIPYSDGRFDKVLSVHTLYFWRDPIRVFHEVHRALKPAGSFVLGFRPQEDTQTSRDFPESVYTFYSRTKVQDLLEASGFFVRHMMQGNSARGICLAVAQAKNGGKD